MSQQPVEQLVVGASRAEHPATGRPRLRLPMQSDGSEKAQAKGRRAEEAEEKQQKQQQLQQERKKKADIEDAQDRSTRKMKRARAKEDGDMLMSIGSRPKECHWRNGLSRAGQTRLSQSLQTAANEGKVELVRLLLRCGAQVNAQDEQFANTPLHRAAWNGFSETLEVLCKYRANTSIKNKAQFTPLHLASQQGHNQSARLLLMAGAKSHLKNSYGDTPLHTAARYGHAGVARILLSAKSDPNQVNLNHDTPLHIAAAMGRRKLTKIFMQSGAEPAIKNKQGETAMDIALRKHLIDIQELIANPPAVGRRSPGSHTRRHAYSLSSRLELAVDVPTGCRPVGAPLAESRLSPKLRRTTSPGGSARSSVSRSRGRLLVSRAARRKSLADLDQVVRCGARRPNLGTCMGKLSLLRLRQMEHMNRTRPGSAGATPADDSDSGPEESACHQEEKQSENRPASGSQQVLGRRALVRHRQRAALQLRAPNGTQLLVSRPLASLTDGSQLYAIPRKAKGAEHKAPASRCNDNVQQVGQVANRAEQVNGQSGPDQDQPDIVSSNNADRQQVANERAGNEPNSERLSPALTSDERHTPGLHEAAHAQCSCQPPEVVAEMRPPLHLESAGQSGYYAYSPVVVSRDEPNGRLEPPGGTKQKQVDKKSSSKRSWLMSKFSLSSSNVSHSKRTSDSAHHHEEPQRRAELISVPEARTTPELVRPKSAMSGLSAELVAAQKSLAAAAAAKVRRDRLVRLADALKPAATNATSQSLLTVRTQQLPGADQLWLKDTCCAQSTQTTGSGGAIRTGHSGTNSAGMSDSSPSNNGADSDNSTQTTGSLGILSRILLHSRTRQSAQTQPHPVTNQSPLSSPATDSGSTGHPNHQVHQSPSQLDQMGSRSRRPIVLSRSGESHESRTLVASLAPEVTSEPVAASDLAPTYGPVQPLCDFHALARSNQHLSSAQMLGHSNYYRNEQANQNGYLDTYPAMPVAYHLSQHDLSRSSDTCNDYYLSSQHQQYNPELAYGLLGLPTLVQPPYDAEHSQIYIPPAYLMAAQHSSDVFAAQPKSALDEFLVANRHRNPKQPAVSELLHSISVEPGRQAPASQHHQQHFDGPRADSCLTVLPAEPTGSLAGSVPMIKADEHSNSSPPVAGSATGGQHSLNERQDRERTGAKQDATGCKQSEPAQEDCPRDADHTWPAAKTNVYKSLVQVNRLPPLQTANKSNQSSDSALAGSSIDNNSHHHHHHHLHLEHQQHQQTNSTSSGTNSSATITLGKNSNSTSLLHLVAKRQDETRSNRLVQQVKTHLVGRHQLQTNSTSASNGINTPTDCSSASTTSATTSSLLINKSDTCANNKLRLPATDRDSVESGANSTDSWSSPGQLNVCPDSPLIQCAEDGASTLL